MRKLYLLLLLVGLVISYGCISGEASFETSAGKYKPFLDDLDLEEMRQIEEKIVCTKQEDGLDYTVYINGDNYGIVVGDNTAVAKTIYKGRTGYFTTEPKAPVLGECDWVSFSDNIAGGDILYSPSGINDVVRNSQCEYKDFDDGIFNIEGKVCDEKELGLSS